MTLLKIFLRKTHEGFLSIEKEGNLTNLNCNTTDKKSGVNVEFLLLLILLIFTYIYKYNRM